jgi:enamine deaminase RidA (YjgF/YER057c/UK114 family)
MRLTLHTALVAAMLAGTSLLVLGQQKKPIPARPPEVRYLNPSGLSTPRGYSHVVEVRNGRMIFIAGQVAQDPKGEVVGVNDFRAQANQVFENLQIALQAVGADFSNVVKLNTYVLDMSQLPVLREVRDKYFANIPNRPASTAVQVQKLARDQFLLEIEAVAVLPDK